MAFQFTPDLKTGNITIDNQHTQLFDAINGFLGACSRSEGKEELSRALKFVSDYTSKHFSDEEGLQMKSAYPGYNTHRRYHEEFKKSVAGLADMFESQGPSMIVLAKFNNLISNWLINHIKREDIKVAAHIRSI